MDSQYFHDVIFGVTNQRCTIIGIATFEADRRGLEGTELVRQISDAFIKDGFLFVNISNLGQFLVVSLKQPQSMSRIKDLAYVLANAFLKSEDQ